MVEQFNRTSTISLHIKQCCGIWEVNSYHGGKSASEEICISFLFEVDAAISFILNTFSKFIQIIRNA